MNKLTIKVKLILLFIVIKIVPLIIITYISYKGIKNLNEYMNDSTTYLYNQSKEIILNTANESINNSIENLNKKSQLSLERLSLEVAEKISEFLKQRDEDILFLSKMQINDKLLEDFFNNKKKEIVVHNNYIYDKNNEKWISAEIDKNKRDTYQPKILKDNKQDFNYMAPLNVKTKTIPIYKEISFFNLNGKEENKVSLINKKKLDVSIKSNTYINSESYFEEIKLLKEGEIYVSDVIGEYVGSKVMGVFTEAKAKKANIPFIAENYAYAGLENPNGKRFEGIIRFITPVFKNKIKVGYLSFALNHRHIMEYTDNLNPIGVYTKMNISDASNGNYAFMWDYKGRNISHPRDYFIVGFDKNSGQRVPGWISIDTNEEFLASGSKSLNEFLKTYPIFKDQKLKQKANMSQLTNNGEIPLDCRYLNFAPHCNGWMEITKDGGHGSFVIYWSGVLKLVTAAPIKYNTGKYKNSKRGFGFITIGANVDQFHAAANKTKDNIEDILDEQSSIVKDIVDDNRFEINSFISGLIKELTFISLFMIIIVIIIALLMSSYISSKIEKLLIGTKMFANNQLDYRIKVDSDDEIGNLENSFNEMASKIDILLKEQNELNEHLEESVNKKTKELIEINEDLENRIKKVVLKNRQKDAQLIQNNKMASIGEMISMIIHQWKQPLNAISMINSSAELRVLIGKNSDEELKKDNLAIKKQVELMSSTMEDFRNFFKNKVKTEYVVSSMIKKSLKLIQKIYNYQGIFIKYEVEDGFKEAKTLGYENEIIQVMINVLNNSRDAILINKSEIKTIDVNCSIKNDDLIISIQDYAGGISDEIKSNIFDAYFTTKEKDDGTGLGLYMVKTILEKVNGTITLENKDTLIDYISYKGVNFVIKLKKETNG
ncbi:MAG: two-component sensor histidine kinase [Arcobacter sp.]|nr:two-component sensor histidine kinase [Arcobacter sp.]|tara:strand:- start:7511 stop:10171 length:2661 start_codon:yes stop_codon:yes gene_type:complete